MGTYYTCGTGDMTWKEFIFSEMNRPDHQILQCSIKGSVAYLACKVKTGEVYGLVLQLKTGDGDKGYKPVEETMGPYETGAPKSLIAKLTPTDNEYANKWRQVCLENAAKRKVKVGDKIQLPSPISWRYSGGNYSDDTFEVIRMTGVRGLVFKSTKGGLIRLTGIDRRQKTFLN